jgi:hypothetical protein
VQRWTGDYQLAADSFTQAAALYRDVGDRLREGLAFVRLGAVHRLTGHYQAAHQGAQHCTRYRLAPG